MGARVAGSEVGLLTGYAGSLWLDIRAFGDLRPLDHFGRNEITELLRRAVARFDARILQGLAQGYMRL